MSACQELTQTSTTACAADSPAPKDFALEACERCPQVHHGLGHLGDSHAAGSQLSAGKPSVGEQQQDEGDLALGKCLRLCWTTGKMK